jgi:hypothetical protein
MGERVEARSVKSLFNPGRTAAVTQEENRGFR